MNTNERTKTFDTIATELCRRVSCPYPPPKGMVIQPQDYAWTEAEENDFRKWMMGYLKTVPMFKRMGKPHMRKEVAWFILQYSWKYKGGKGVEDETIR